MQDKKQDPLAILKNSHSFFQEILRDVIFASVVKSFPQLSTFKKESIKIEHPLQENYGDYSTSVAMTLVKDIHKNPKEISQQILDSINDVIKEHLSISEKTYKNNKKQITNNINDILENISIAGSGFINITIKPQFLISYIDSLPGDKRDDSVRSILEGSKIMVEFAHPNTHKAFHIGHLRNITTGESIIRLLESQGNKVIRANYQGDVGMHIAKCLYALIHLEPFKTKVTIITGIKERVELLGKAYAAGSKAFEENTDAAAQIKDINFLIYAAAQRLAEENGVERSSTDYLKFVSGRTLELDKVYQLWKQTRQWSLDYFESIYKRVNTHYDRLYFESECLKGVDIAKDAVKKGILTESKGAIIFNGEPYGLDTRVFVNSLGLPTYEGKELALAYKEFSEYGHIDKLVHVLGPEQVSFTEVTFKVQELLGIQKNQQLHLVYGWVKLKHGKMSSRMGNVILGEWLLDEAKKKIREIMRSNQIKNAEWAATLPGNQLHKEGKELTKKEIEDVSERLAIAAVKYSMLKVGIPSEIAFDLDESISLEGDSGPYLMYTFARCKSVFRKLESRIKGKNSVSNFDVLEFNKKELLLSSEELGVLRTLYKFPEVILEATRNFSPNVLCTYLFDLAQKYNGFYHKHTIIQKTNNKEQITEEKFRLWLTQKTSEVIEKGLYLLGIETVEKM